MRGIAQAGVGASLVKNDIEVVTCWHFDGGQILGTLCVQRIDKSLTLALELRGFDFSPADDGGRKTRQIKKLRADRLCACHIQGQCLIDAGANQGLQVVNAGNQHRRCGRACRQIGIILPPTQAAHGRQMRPGRAAGNDDALRVKAQFFAMLM